MTAVHAGEGRGWLVGLAAAAVTFFIAYLMCAFIRADLNPFAWSEGARAQVICVWILLGLPTSLVAGFGARVRR